MTICHILPERRGWVNTISTSHSLQAELAGARVGGAVEYTDCISTEWWDSSNKCPGYDAKQSDSEAPVRLKLWGMYSTPLPFLPGPL